MAQRTTQEERDETVAERADRNLTELLGELRVALPGVQVLFAFLLVVPFNTGFESVTEFQKGMYFGTLICTALASGLLIAPSMHHRLVFRKGDKDYLVRRSNRLAIVGLTLLALAMGSAVVLVTDYLFGAVTTIVTAAVIAAWFGAFWYLTPLRRLREIGEL